METEWKGETIVLHFSSQAAMAYFLSSHKGKGAGVIWILRRKMVMLVGSDGTQHKICQFKLRIPSNLAIFQSI